MQDRLKTLDGWRIIGVLSSWGGAALTALRLQDLPYDFGHGICGPWGCGPPVQALLACHAFWLVNLAAVLWISHYWFDIHWQRRVANVALAVAVIGLLSVAAHEAMFWWPNVTGLSRPYVAQRYLFRVATLVDVPLVQLALFGIAGRRLQHRRSVAVLAAITERFPTDDASCDAGDARVRHRQGMSATLYEATQIG